MNREEVIKDCYKIINLGRKGASFPMKIIKEQLARAYNKGFEASPVWQVEEMVERIVKEVEAHLTEQYGEKEGK